MRHLDLFSGIGGFALAVDRVWSGATHIFCDNDLFCQAILEKHWPNSKIYGDIRSITTDTPGDGCDSGTTLEQGRQDQNTQVGKNTPDKQIRQGWECEFGQIDLLTGGFPCQPFSVAGRRRGTEDDRYLWPEMLRVIQLTKPTWIIAENVGGLVTWNDGMVLEQVCLDLEAQGYEVQPFIVPACAVNAPHRRDRVWIVAHKLNTGLEGSSHETSGHFGFSSGEWSNQTQDNHAQDTVSQRGRGRMESGGQILEGASTEAQDEGSGWEKNWVEVATRLCRVDDGVPRRMDRTPRLKALGNSIVPQVAEKIMRAIRLTE